MNHKPDPPEKRVANRITSSILPSLVQPAEQEVMTEKNDPEDPYEEERRAEKKRYERVDMFSADVTGNAVRPDHEAPDIDHELLKRYAAGKLNEADYLGVDRIRQRYPIWEKTATYYVRLEALTELEAALQKIGRPKFAADDAPIIRSEVIGFVRGEFGMDKDAECMGRCELYQSWYDAVLKEIGEEQNRLRRQGAPGR